MRIVQQRHNYETGTLVQIIDNRDEWFDVGGQPWITFCDDHSIYCEHRTRALAMSHAAGPSLWCDGCAKIRDARGASAVAYDGHSSR